MQKKLTRSTTDRTICGVCSGIARYFDLDPTIVRLVWAIGTLFSMGLGIIGYIAAAFIIPEDQP